MNPLMMNWTRNLFDILREGEDGTGSGGDAGGDTGADAGNGGDGGAEADAGKTPAPVLGGGTGKADDNSDDDGQASKEGAEGDDGAGDEPDNTVPGEGEDYDFTLPEGVEMDAAMAEAMSPLLKQMNIGRADANALAEALTGYLSGQAEATMNAYVEKVEGWTAAARKDPELGADWEKNTQIANAGLQKFGTPELTAALQETGMSNHPEMIRFMYRVAKATGNDTLDRGKEVDTSDIPAETSWYGKTTPDKKAG